MIKDNYLRKTITCANILYIILVIAICGLFFWQGNIRDLYNISNDTFWNDSTCQIVIFASAMLVFVILLNILWKRKCIVASCIVFITISIICLGHSFYQSINYYTSFAYKKASDSYLVSITLEDLKTSTINKKDEITIIYIGRDSCAVCTEIQPVVEDYAKRTSQDIYYYNTTNDRKTNCDEMIKCLMGYKCMKCLLLL